MKKFVEFVKESWIEITKKVTWDSWSTLQASAMLTLVASIIFALVVGFMDYVIQNALELLLKSI